MYCQPICVEMISEDLDFRTSGVSTSKFLMITKYRFPIGNFDFFSYKLSVLLDTINLSKLVVISK